MARLSLLKNVIVMCLFPGISYAADTIVGGTVGYQHHGNSSASELSSSQERGINYQIKNGLKISDTSRLYGTYSFNSDDMNHHQGVLVSYDRLFSLDEAKHVSWFIGGSAGLSDHEFQFNDIDQIYRDSSSCYVFGGQTGLMFDFGNALTSELGFRYLKHNFTSSDKGMNATSLSVNDAEQVYWGIDFTF
ncbi:hypothetical protein [Shewanella sp. KT0246]|uniref:hypothetical protein n=1 Tax=Shewanella sp. KT0246 TaxID=2815912 RepID=UPI001BC31C43|nr:hypothetical protein [Shewanella sp. KT0246]GIU53881.1 hypothetical protein TUM4249_35220 [Shewanella sp. KT0246]